MAVEKRDQDDSEEYFESSRETSAVRTDICDTSDNSTIRYLVNELLDSVERKKTFCKRTVSTRSSSAITKRSEFEVLFSYKSPYYSGNIDVTKDGRDRLEEGEMLNDSIINFYLLYMLTDYIDRSLQQSSVSVEIARKIAQDRSKLRSDYIPSSEEAPILELLHPLLRRFEIASTFVYPNLRKLYTKDGIRMEQQLVSWDRKVDLLHKEFILFPVFDRSHWSLSVICQPACLYEFIRMEATVFGVDYSKRPLLRKQPKRTNKKYMIKEPRMEKVKKKEADVLSVCEDNMNVVKETVYTIVDEKDTCQIHHHLLENPRILLPYILVIDSYHNGSHTDTFCLRHFTQYLMKISTPSVQYKLHHENFLAYVPTVTQQQNSVDCGIFLLLYAELFVNQYQQFILDKRITGCTKAITKNFEVLQINAEEAQSMRRKIASIIDGIVGPRSLDVVKVVETDESDIECLEVVMMTKKPKRLSSMKAKVHNDVKIVDSVTHNGSQNQNEKQGSQVINEQKETSSIDSIII